MCASETGADRDTAALFAQRLDRQLTLCDALERLADSLPARIDTSAACALSEQLCLALQQSHTQEETEIFPALVGQHPEIEGILDRLRREHLEDDAHANDLRDALAAHALGRDRQAAEELGYLLRCLFMSLRRHLAFDRDHLLPLYRQVSAGAENIR